MQVEVGTKADAGFINESNIHDLYVFLFDKDDMASGSPRKVYGRYFNFDHRRSSLAELNAHHNECWFVENKSINSPDAPTRGAVKISTVTRDNVALVVLANVDNAVMELDGNDEIARLDAVEDLDELRGLSVRLEQDIVNRKNLFLMMGTLGYEGNGINTGSMQWNRPAPNDFDYNPDYKVKLIALDAKVKFRVKANTDYISNVTPVYWQVCMLENRLSPAKAANNYYQRELQNKTVSSDDGYDGPASNTYGSYFIDNGEWEYANPNSTYVKFDLILTLTSAGIAAMGADDPSSGMEIGHALTSDAIFTVMTGGPVSTIIIPGAGTATLIMLL